jgi:hypothetical protein
MNKYYFYINNLELDIEELKSVFNSLEKNWICYKKPSNKTLWALSYDLDSFFQLKSSKQFKREYIDNVAFFMTKADGQVMPHTDTRPTSFLIPISGNFEKSRVEFYDNYLKAVTVSVDTDTDKFASSTTVYRVGVPDCQINYTTPILINTKIIHSVKNEVDVDRIVMSISFDKNLSYEEVYNLYTSGELFTASS